jgi:hypothetical protein
LAPISARSYLTPWWWHFKVPKHVGEYWVPIHWMINVFVGFSFTIQQSFSFPEWNWTNIYRFSLCILWLEQNNIFPNPAENCFTNTNLLYQRTVQKRIKLLCTMPCWGFMAKELFPPLCCKTWQWRVKLLDTTRACSEPYLHISCCGTWYSII